MWFLLICLAMLRTLLSSQMTPIANQYLKYIEVGHSNLVRQRLFSQKIEFTGQFYTISYRRSFKEAPQLGISICDIAINSEPNRNNDFGLSIMFEYLQKKAHYFRVQASYTIGFVQKLNIRYLAVKYSNNPHEPICVEESYFQASNVFLSKNLPKQDHVYSKNMASQKQFKYLYFIKGFTLFQKYRMPAAAQIIQVSVINATYGHVYYTIDSFNHNTTTMLHLQLTWVLYTQSLINETTLKIGVLALNSLSYVYSESSLSFFDNKSVLIGISSINASQWMIDISFDLAVPNQISIKSLNVVPEFNISFFAFLSFCGNQTIFYSDNNHQCYDKCPDKYYQYQKTYSCIHCPYDCLSCDLNGNCLSCDEQKMFRKLNSATFRCQPKKGYFDNNSQVCVKCQKGCQSCISLTNCLKCMPNHFMGLDHICYLECPNGFFNSNKMMQCKRCPLDCFACQDNVSCLSCKEEHFRQLDLESRRCLAKEGYFDQGHLQCSRCQSGCTKCSSLDSCFSCQSNYYLRDFKCLGCPQGCESCFSNSSCKQCITDYYLSQKYCVSECPKGYYPFSAQKTCKICPSNCPACNQPNQCSENLAVNQITALIGIFLTIISFALQRKRCIQPDNKNIANITLSYQFTQNNINHLQKDISVYQARFGDSSFNQTHLQVSSPNKLLQTQSATQEDYKKDDFSIDINSLKTEQNELGLQNFQLQRNLSQDTLKEQSIPPNQQKVKSPLKASHPEGNPDCVICDQKNNDMLIETNCTFGVHRFHMFCLMRWAKFHDSCPVCRDPLWQYDHKLLCKQCKTSHLLNLYVIEKLCSEQVILIRGCLKCKALSKIRDKSYQQV